MYYIRCIWVSRLSYRLLKVIPRSHFFMFLYRKITLNCPRIIKRCIYAYIIPLLVSIGKWLIWSLRKEDIWTAAWMEIEYLSLLIIMKLLNCFLNFENVMFYNYLASDMWTVFFLPHKTKWYETLLKKNVLVIPCQLLYFYHALYMLYFIYYYRINYLNIYYLYFIYGNIIYKVDIQYPVKETS